MYISVKLFLKWYYMGLDGAPRAYGTPRGVSHCGTRGTSHFGETSPKHIRLRQGYGEIPFPLPSREGTLS